MSAALEAPCLGTTPDPAEPEVVLSAFDRSVYRAIAVYAFDEAECCPSQRLLALDLRCARETINRAVARLVRAGWLLIRKRRRAGWPWDHNVYELLEPYAVSVLAAKRIIRRAHKRARRAARRLSRHPLSAPDHTKDVVLGEAGETTLSHCRCRACRVDRASIRRPPPPVYSRPLPHEEQMRRAIEDRLRERREAGEALAVEEQMRISRLRLFVDQERNR